MRGGKVDVFMSMRIWEIYEREWSKGLLGRIGNSLRVLIFGAVAKQMSCDTRAARDTFVVTIQ